MPSADDAARERARAPQSAAVPEQRRQATVLFSDLSGYTAMSERLDPEEVLEITHRILGDAARIIESYGGHVEKLLGDAILAVFGVPRAHDDDAARAVRAALDISAAADRTGSDLEPELGVRLSMHAGISTGLVVTGAHAPSSGRESLVGDVVNVASRLTSVASAGQVVVSAETYRLASSQISFESLGEVHVKGKSEPLKAYRAIGPIQRGQHSSVSLGPPLVGRDGELGVLTDAWRRVELGERMIVAVKGEPGTGKSRLVSELRARLNRDAQWFEGASAEWESSTPYRLFADMVARMSGLRATDGPDRVRERVELLVADSLGERPETAAYLCGLLGIEHSAMPPTDPLAWHRALQNAVRTLLDACCSAKPTVLFLEDLHWADPSSLELAENLLDAEAPALLLCCHRPEFAAFAGRSDVIRVNLADLDAEDAAKLVDAILVAPALAQADDGRVSAQLVAYLGQRAGGNPLFVGEMLRSLQESGGLVHDGRGWELAPDAGADEIPSTINGVVLARLDRLEDSARALAEDAAVLGQQFSRGLLEMVSSEVVSIDSGLKELVDAGLVVPDTTAPTERFEFKHAIVHNAAYESLLRRDRAARHRAVVSAVENRWPERAVEMCEMLAFHADRGEQPDKATRYLALAGERAVERYALREAFTFYARGIELAESLERSSPDGSDALRLLLDQMYVLDYLGDFHGIEIALTDRRNLVLDVTAPGDAALYFGWLAFSLSMQERHRETSSLLARAQALAERSGDALTLAHVAAWDALSAAQAGDLERSVSRAREAQSLVADEGPGRYVHMIALNALSSAYFFKGDVAREADIADRLLAQGRLGDLRREVSGRIAIGLASQAAGDYELAATRFRDAVGIATEPLFVDYATFMLGVSLVMGNEMEAAEEVLTEVIDFSSKFGTRLFGMTSEGLRGIRAFATGNLAEGVALTQAAARQAAESGNRYRRAMHTCSLGRAYLQLVLRDTRPDWTFLRRNAVFLARNVPFAAKRSESYLMDSIGFAEAIGARGVAGQAYQLLGRLFAATGKRAQARQAFQAALERFDECSAYQFAVDTREALSAIGDS